MGRDGMDSDGAARGTAPIALVALVALAPHAHPGLRPALPL